MLGAAAIPLVLLVLLVVLATCATMEALSDEGAPDYA